MDKITVVNKLKSVHGDKYDYSLIEDIDTVDSKIIVRCPKHDFIWYPTFHNHFYNKRGCPKCGRERNVEARRLKKSVFIERSIKTHNDIDNYNFDDLSLNNKDEYGKIEKFCKKHGGFWIRPSHFMNGVGCPICSGSEKIDDEVRDELSRIHPELDFSISEFSKHDEHYRIKVICPKHGIRNLSYYNLKYGQGCDICRYDKIAQKKSMTYEEFVRRAEEVHGIGRYIFEIDTNLRKDENDRIIVTCPIHGDFKVNMYNFLQRKSGCPLCGESHLEKEVRINLENNNIIF